MALKKNKKIKYSSIIYTKSACPKCNSDNVAEISILQLTERENMKILEENLRHDLRTYFVSPKEYKDYYSEYHLNTRCLDCKYEYFSKTQKINRKDLENFEDSEDSENDITVVDKKETNTSNQNVKKHPESKLSRILKILKE